MNLLYCVRHCYLRIKLTLWLVVVHHKPLGNPLTIVLHVYKKYFFFTYTFIKLFFLPKYSIVGIYITLKRLIFEWGVSKYLESGCWTEVTFLKWNPNDPTNKIVRLRGTYPMYGHISVSVLWVFFALTDGRYST